MSVRVALFATALIITGLYVSLPAARAASPPAGACADARHRQFDFWQGHWNVYKTGTSRQVGTNNVTRELGGCVLQEHWSGNGGGTGTSFNIYDAPSHRWHQTWVDSSGGLLVLDGSFQNGKMTLSGNAAGANGGNVLNRIQWTPNLDGSVRQLWTSSRDGGKTWTIVFDGTYKRASR